MTQDRDNALLRRAAGAVRAGGDAASATQLDQAVRRAERQVHDCPTCTCDLEADARASHVCPGCSCDVTETTPDARPVPTAPAATPVARPTPSPPPGR